jgi:hypothetical protein
MKDMLYEAYKTIKQSTYKKYNNVTTNCECAVNTKHVGVTAVHATTFVERIRYQPGQRDTPVAAC